MGIYYRLSADGTNTLIIDALSCIPLVGFR
jgi:hypothetical protein